LATDGQQLSGRSGSTFLAATMSNVRIVIHVPSLHIMAFHCQLELVICLPQTFADHCRSAKAAIEALAVVDVDYRVSQKVSLSRYWFLNKLY